MTLSRESEILGRSPLFRGVDPAQLRLLALMAENRTFHRGEALMVQGEDGNAALVILSGEAEVLLRVDGIETQVARIGPTEIVGEMALLSDARRSATVRALETVQVLRLDRATLLRLLREFPGMSLELLRVMAGRLERTTQELARARADLAARTAAG